MLNKLPTDIIDSYNEKILSIREKEYTHKNLDNLLGWEVKTDSQTIYLGISQEENCCEYFGHSIECEDSSQNITDYIGAIVIDVKLDERDDDVERVRDKFNIKDDYICGDYVGVCTLSIYTSIRKLILIVWNHHNGYYPHSIGYKYGDKEDFTETL